MLKLCAERYGYSQPGACEVNEFIRSQNPTPAEFDKKIATLDNYKLENGDTHRVSALSTAASVGNVALIEHIVKIGGTHLLNMGDDCGMTPLFMAVGDGCGMTPLFMAVECKDKEARYLAAKKLIDLGADVNIAFTENGENWYSPLALAVKDINNLALVKLLLKNGSSEEVPWITEEGKKLLDGAKNEVEEEEITGMVSESTFAKERPKLKLCEQRCVLQPCGDEVNEFIKTQKPTPDQFETKIATIENYNLKEGDSKRVSALAAAASVGNAALIQYIVERGGNSLLNMGDRSGLTPLHHAANCEDSEAAFQAAQKLIELGADVNIAFDENGEDWYSPLALALDDVKKFAFVKALLASGANTYVPWLSNEKRETLNQATKEVKEEARVAFQRINLILKTS